MAEFQSVLDAKGLRAALRFLNTQTPHRFTGVYRFDHETLRNIALCDRHNPAVDHGEDLPMANAPCARVGDFGTHLVVDNLIYDTRFERDFGGIVSYCGALLRTPNGRAFGTLCHYDSLPCESPPNIVSFLELVAPLIFAALPAGI